MVASLHPQVCEALTSSTIYKSALIWSPYHSHCLFPFNTWPLVALYTHYTADWALSKTVWSSLCCLAKSGLALIMMEHLFKGRNLQEKNMSWLDLEPDCCDNNSWSLFSSGGYSVNINSLKFIYSFDTLTSRHREDLKNLSTFGAELYEFVVVGDILG